MAPARDTQRRRTTQLAFTKRATEEPAIRGGRELGAERATQERARRRRGENDRTRAPPSEVGGARVQ